MNAPSNVMQEFRQSREDHDISREDVAREINAAPAKYENVKVTGAYIYQLETGRRRNPSHTLVVNLQKALKAIISSRGINSASAGRAA